MDKTPKVVEQILRGEVRAAARLMRELDDGEPASREVLKTYTVMAAGPISSESPGLQEWARAPSPTA